MTRVLVTGAGGFIGANLVRALAARGDDVHAMVQAGGNLWRLDDIRESITLHEADMSKRDEVARAVGRAMPELVFHLAHYGGNRGQADAAMVRRVIIEGTAALYDACQAAGGVRAIVQAGSSSEYGRKREPMREDMVPEPNTDYGAAKVWATLYGEHMRREKGMPVTTLRLFNVYGPYEAPARFFPGVILALLRGQEPKVSSPDTARDFIHVDDVVEAFLLAAQKPSGVYNVGTGVQTTLKEAAEAIRAELGSSVEFAWGSYQDQSFDSAFWQADQEHARAALGWSARIGLKEGVRRTIDWFNTHQDLYA